MHKILPIWNWLPTFRVVAEHGSFSKGAAALHVTVAAVSKTVKQLERHLGFEILRRDTKTLTMTARGRELYSLVRDAMRNIDDALFDEARCTVGIHGSLRHLRALCEGHVSILSQQRGTLAVLSGQIDLFITSKPIADSRLTSTEPVHIEIKMNNRPVATVATYLVTRQGYVLAPAVTAQLEPVLARGRRS